MSDKPKSMPDNWFLVIGTNSEIAPRLAYPSKEHADAIASANNHEYPLSGPWLVVPMMVAA